jgi:hypothetical protein
MCCDQYPTGTEQEMKRLSKHLRANAIAYLALFVALGGTSYAAINLPAHSVGTRQLRDGSVTSRKLANGSVTPAKLDGHSVGGSIRHWAFVNQDGRVIGGSRGVRVLVRGGAPPYYVSWGDQFSHSCAVLANSPGSEGFGPIAGSIGIHVNEPGNRHGATVAWVWPFSSGKIINARFYIAVIC